MVFSETISLMAFGPPQVIVYTSVVIRHLMSCTYPIVHPSAHTQCMITKLLQQLWLGRRRVATQQGIDLPQVRQNKKGVGIWQRVPTKMKEKYEEEISYHNMASI